MISGPSGFPSHIDPSVPGGGPSFPPPSQVTVNGTVFPGRHSQPRPPARPTHCWVPPSGFAQSGRPRLRSCKVTADHPVSFPAFPVTHAISVTIITTSAPHVLAPSSFVPGRLSPVLCAGTKACCDDTPHRRGAIIEFFTSIRWQNRNPLRKRSKDNFMTWVFY